MNQDYFNGQQDRMNKVTFTTTLVKAIFMPGSFLAGVFGMNFNHGKWDGNPDDPDGMNNTNCSVLSYAAMPDICTTWGYYMFWGIYLTIACGMLIYFRAKSWL